MTARPTRPERPRITAQNRLTVAHVVTTGALGPSTREDLPMSADELAATHTTLEHLPDDAVLPTKKWKDALADTVFAARTYEHDLGELKGDYHALLRQNRFLRALLAEAVEGGFVPKVGGLRPRIWPSYEARLRAMTEGVPPGQAMPDVVPERSSTPKADMLLGALTYDLLVQQESNPERVQVRVFPKFPEASLKPLIETTLDKRPSYASLCRLISSTDERPERQEYLWIASGQGVQCAGLVILPLPLDMDMLNSSPKGGDQ